MNNKETVHALADLVLDKKAQQVKILNMSELTTLADYFLLLTAKNKKHAQAIADSITDKMRVYGKRLLNESGYREGSWILQDFGDIIVHIFIEEERTYYNLDAMWGDAEIEQDTSGE